MRTRDQARLNQLQQLLETHPDDPLLHFGFARECIRHHRYQDAVPALQKAIRLHPDYSAAYRELGRCLTALRRLKEARHIFEEGMTVARRMGDLQTFREMEVFYKRLEDQAD